MKGNTLTALLQAGTVMPQTGMRSNKTGSLPGLKEHLHQEIHLQIHQEETQAQLHQGV